MFAEVLLTAFRSFQKYSSQPLDRQCGKALNCKRMEKSENIRTCSDCSDCSREDNLIDWRSIWKHSGDPYLKANWQRNRVTVAYISVLFKRCYVADNVEHFSHFLVGFLFRYCQKIIQKWTFKKRAPVYLISEILLPWTTVITNSRN